MKNKIYIFSIFPWESKLLHREHMLAKAFDSLGYEVYFVERSYKSLPGTLIRKSENVNIITVFGLPYLRGYFRWIFKLNDLLIASQLSRLIDKDDDNWYLLSSPLWSKSVNTAKGNNQAYIYDISDDHLEYATNSFWKKNLKIYEDFAIKSADLVTVTSEALLGKMPKGKKVALVENGVDLASNEKATRILKKQYAGKIVGFIGGIYQRVDLGLVKACAEAYPEAEFVLVGPTDKNNQINELKKYKNFHYLGAIPWNKVQDYFASLDVGIVPFVSDGKYPWLKTVNSVKVYQYAYYGYPIVTSNYGQVKDLEPVVKVADNEEDFVRFVGEALTTNEKPEVVRQRVELAKEHDWKNLAKKFINNVLE